MVLLELGSFFINVYLGSVFAVVAVVEAKHAMGPIIALLYLWTETTETIPSLETSAETLHLSMVIQWTAHRL
jgi:hypothetical protein